MPAAAVAAPVWLPDTDPAHTLCHLLDCLLAAHLVVEVELRDGGPSDRRHEDEWPPPMHPDDLADIRQPIRDAAEAIRRTHRSEGTGRLTAAAVARLVRASDTAAPAQTAVLAAVTALNGLLALPDRWYAPGEPAAVRAAEVARDGLVLALARCGEPPPAHDCRGIDDPYAALPALYRARGRFGGPAPAQYPSPLALPVAAQEVRSRVSSGPVVPHAPDGPGPDHVIHWKGRTVRLKGVQYRVVAYMWTRDAAGFAELADHVNENRRHEAPTPDTYKTWVCRGNKALEPLGLPRRLRADTVNRRIYWEDVPVAPASGSGFRDETGDETAVTPA